MGIITNNTITNQLKGTSRHLRQGYILIEVVLSLAILSMLCQLGTQMLSSVRLDIHQTIQQVRAREMTDLIWRLNSIAPKMTQVRITSDQLTFYNAKVRDDCTLGLNKQRLVYRKHDRGYYVCCTQVDAVNFQRISAHTVLLKITFLDGTNGEAKLAIHT